MTITETIKKAIEGGYKLPEKYIVNKDTIEIKLWNGGDDTEWTPKNIYLDPLFWQSLGKSLGWDKKAKKGYVRFCDIKDESGNTQFYWNYMWHRFIDSLASGKSIEEFFNEL